MIYYCDEIVNVSSGIEKEIDKCISFERLTYANQFKFRYLQLQEKFSYILLRVGLYREFNIYEFPHISLGEYGKPYLTGCNNIFFNMSHCRTGVACGISRSEIGVDIQDYIVYDQAMALMFMSEEEMQFMQEENKSEIFTKIWALKESYGKYTGQGICYDMNSFSVEKKYPCTKAYFYPEFVLAITAKEKMNIVCVTLDDILNTCIELEKN